MTKIYIKFGEPLPDEDHIYVYEASVEDSVIKLVMPSLSYQACQNLAGDIELPAYAVEGRYIGKDNLGQPILREHKIISKLKFDKQNECYHFISKITEPDRPNLDFMRKPSKVDKLIKNENIKDDTLTALVGFGIGRVLRLFNHSDKEKSQYKKTTGSYKFKPYET